MEQIINLVKRPTLDNGAPESNIWLTATVPPSNATIGGRDAKGNPMNGLEVGTIAASRAVVTEVEGLEPGEPYELQIRPPASGGSASKVHAGLYTSLTANPSAGGHSADFEIPASGAAIQTATLEAPADTSVVFLKLIGINGTARIGGVRLSPAAVEPDELGIFDGDTEDTEEYEFTWTGPVNASESLAIPEGADPDPDPDPGNGDEVGGLVGELAGKVAKYLDDDSDETRALAATHVPIVMAYVYGYTKGKGFTLVEPDPESGEPAEPELVPKMDLQHVIISATGRLTPNPEQISYYQAGDYSERPAVLAGWTLLERAILNQYRVRWA